MSYCRLTVITSLLIVLGMLVVYQWVFSENGEYKYFDKNGKNLFAWGKPFQACTIVTPEYERSIGKIPILGVDSKGQDLAHKLSIAISTNLFLALPGAIIFIFLGTLSGVVNGYDQSVITKSLYQKMRTGKDILISLKEVNFTQIISKNIIQTLHSIPLLLLLLVVVITANKFFENDLFRMYAAMLAVGVLSVPKLSLLIQDRIKMLEDEEFINAARASGLADSKIILKHILWYECSPIIVGQFIFIIVQAIMLEVVISFLGYGFGIGSYTTLGTLIKFFQQNFPGNVTNSDPLSLLPLIVLLVVTFAGNILSKLFLDLRYE